MCMVENCDKPSTQSWQRQATQAEIDHFHQTGDLPPWETTAQMTIDACDEHALPPDLAAVPHLSDCLAPPKCNCRTGPAVLGRLQSAVAATEQALATP